MSDRPRILDQLGAELDRVARGRLAGSGALRQAPRRLRVLGVIVGLLVLAAAATAAVLLIQQGPALPAPHAQDLRVAGDGARSVTAYGPEGTRALPLGPRGSFITVYRGRVEDVRPRIVIVSRDGRAHPIAFAQFSAF